MQEESKNYKKHHHANPNENTYTMITYLCENNYVNRWHQTEYLCDAKLAIYRLSIHRGKSISIQWRHRIVIILIQSQSQQHSWWINLILFSGIIQHDIHISKDVLQPKMLTLKPSSLQIQLSVYRRNTGQRNKINNATRKQATKSKRENILQDHWPSLFSISSHH